MRRIFRPFLLALFTVSAACAGPSDTGVVEESGEDTAPVVDAFALDLSIDPDVAVMVHATWVDPGASESWIEYRWASDQWLVAPAITSESAVILGVLSGERVEARVAAVVGGETVYSAPATVTTGRVPDELLQPYALAYDEALTSASPYFMAVVACGEGWYDGPYAVEIFDRRGNVVWYRWAAGDQGTATLSPTVALDGTHIWYEDANLFGFGEASGSITRTTLDGRWSTTQKVPVLGQAVSEGPDGSFFVERRSGTLGHGIDQIDAQGVISPIWECDPVLEGMGVDGGGCLLNAATWDASRNTILASQFETSTIFEVDVATGATVRQMGALTVGEPYTFDPPESNFAYQHYPHWTPEGTLMVSTHVPCDGTEPTGCNEGRGRENKQVAAEYAVDDATHTLTRVWSYESENPWATQAGEAYRTADGHLIMGFGQDGVVEEITSDGDVAWRLEWPKADDGYRLIGHATPIDDLYALNRGE